MSNFPFQIPALLLAQQDSSNPWEWFQESIAWLAGQPFLYLLGLSLPLLVLGFWLRVFPTRRMYFVLMLPVALAILSVLYRIMLIPTILLDAVLLVVVLADLITVARKKCFDVHRNMVRVASVAKPHRVTLEVRYTGSGATRFEVADDFPADCPMDPPQQSLTLRGRSRSLLHYEVTPNRRGEFLLEKIYLCSTSLLGFWRAFHSFSCPGELNVYPDLKQMSEYSLLAKTNRLSLLGIRRSRRVGQENEFERLRDFTKDDQFKFIDWRASARRNKLTVRDFQVTQSQRIVFLLDCGRMMANVSHGLTMLDHALNSSLMLAYIALSRGDAVGLLCFSDKIECYVPPRAESGQMNRLLHASYNIFPRMVESRYDEAFQFMKTRNPRRSLVVLVTNLIDEINANQVSQYVGNVHGKHLPLAVFLRDHHLFNPLPDHFNETPEDLYTAAAAADILSWRHQVMSGMVHRGAMVLDAFPESLTAPLVNQYLEIKARQIL